MSKVWLKNNKVILQNDKVTLCDECPCDATLCQNECWYDGGGVDGDGTQNSPLGTFEGILGYYYAHNTPANWCACLHVHVMGSCVFTFSEIDSAYAALAQNYYYGIIYLISADKSTMVMDTDFKQYPYTRLLLYLKNFDISETVSVQTTPWVGLENVHQDFTNHVYSETYILIRRVDLYAGNCMGVASRLVDYTFSNVQDGAFNRINAHSQETINVNFPTANKITIGYDPVASSAPMQYYRLIHNLTLHAYTDPGSPGNYRLGSIIIDGVTFPTFHDAGQATVYIAGNSVSNLDRSGWVSGSKSYFMIIFLPVFAPTADSYDVYIYDIVSDKIDPEGYLNDETVFNPTSDGKPVRYHIYNCVLSAVQVSSYSHVYASDSSYVTINGSDRWTDV